PAGAVHALGNGLGPHPTDLGELWRARTGRPMVFAVWAARAEAARERPGDLEGLGRLLQEAQARYVADPEVVVAAAAERFPFPTDFVRTYLRRLRYGFGEAERAGPSRLLELARTLGELDPQPR